MPAITTDEKRVALEVIERVVNEENTDAILEVVVARVKKALPFWLRWIPIGRVLDQLFPGILLDFLRNVLK